MTPYQRAVKKLLATSPVSKIVPLKPAIAEPLTIAEVREWLDACLPVVESEGAETILRRLPTEWLALTLENERYAEVLSRMATAVLHGDLQAAQQIVATEAQKGTDDVTL